MFKVRIAALLASAGVMLCAATGTPAFAQAGPADEDQILLASSETPAPSGTLTTTAVIPTRSALGILSPENGCLREPSPKGLNPAIVDCHASFAPVPFLPRTVDVTSKEDREAVEQERDAVVNWLLARLKRPDTCGEGADLKTSRACAIIVYDLPPEDRLTGIPLSQAVPWTRIAVIYRVKGNLIYMVTSTKGEQVYGTAERPARLLLTEQRMDRCKPDPAVQVGTSVASSGHRDDSCRDMQAAIHTPKLVLSYAEAQRVLSPELVTRVFYAPAYAVNSKRMAGGGSGAEP